MSAITSGSFNNDLVDKLIISFEIESEYSRQIFKRCSGLFHARLKSAIADLFSQYAGDNHRRIMLDSLNIDLGDLDLMHFEHQFMDKFIIGLKQALQQHIQVNEVNQFAVTPPYSIGSPVSAALLVPDKPDIETVGDYLLHGDRAFTARQKQQLVPSVLDKLAFNQLQVEAERWLPMLASRCLQQTSLRQLSQTFSRATLTCLAERLSQTFSRATLTCLAERLMPVGSAAGLSLSVRLVLSALHYLARQPARQLPAVDQQVVQLLIDEKATAIQSEALAKLFSAETLRQSALAPWLAALWQIKPLQNRLRPRLTADICRQADTLLATGNELASVQRELTGQVPPLSGDTPLTIDNAGLLILWPLLPALFNMLGLLDKQQFINPQAQAAAVCLLDQLIWADQQTPEWRLALNKILCGLPIDAEIEWVMPSEQQTKTMDDWLLAMARQLPGWQKLGLSDIRQLFLQRPGQLTQDGQVTRIEVEHQVFDCLLSDWPWPMQIVMLPWLQQPLNVNWL